MAAKVVKKDGAALSELEKSVEKVLVDLQASNHASLKEVLPKLSISAAREVELDAGRKAVLLFVPFPLLSEFRKVHKTLVEELEKKLASHVLIIANRTMLSHAAWSRSGKFSGVRPRSRTLKAVQESLLDDIVYPTEIVGKRTRVRVDGSRLMRVLLNPKDAVALEGKTDTFRAVYKKLTNKDISFEFPSTH